MASQKELAQQLVDELARSKSFEADTARKMVLALYEEAKETLVDAMGEDLLRKQGEAKAMEKLYKRLTNPRVTQQEPE